MRQKKIKNSTIKMVIIGNILLAVAGLFSVLFLIDNLGKTSLGGDAKIGSAYGVFFMCIILFVCIVGVAAIIGWRGGWGWVGSSVGAKFFMVALGLAAVAVGTAYAGTRKEMGPLMLLLAWLPALSWPLLLVGLGILLNGGAAFRWPLLLAAGLGAVPSSMMLFELVKDKVERAIFRDKTKGQPNSNDLRMLDNLAAFDSSTHISNLLIFTGVNQHDTVRRAALAKIKSYPNWQQQLADGLKKGWAPHVFTFLASAEPDDPSLFADPIRDGILLQAADIRKQLREADERTNFWAGEFSWEIECIHRTLVKFEKSGVDYRPAVQELRNALDTPCEAKKPRFGGIQKLLDEWLKKH